MKHALIQKQSSGRSFFLILLFVLGLPLSIFGQSVNETYQRNLKEFRAKWKVELRQNLEKGYGDLIRLQDEQFQNEIMKVKGQFSALQDDGKKQQNPGFVQLKDIAKLELDKVTLNKEQPIKANPESFILQPEIQLIIPAPQQSQPDMIQLGGIVMIKGNNFGIDHGGVALQYQEEAEEFHYPPPPKLIQLIPYENDWGRAWSDELLILQIPAYLPSDKHISPKGELIVYKEGKQHFKVSHSVSINFAGPNIHQISAVPEYGDWKNKICAVSGGILALKGKHLGDNPGRIFLELSEPVHGKLELDLNILEWHDSGILAHVPKIKGLPGYQAALVTIQRKDHPDKNLWSSPIQFGPRLLVANISGMEFLDLAPNDQDDASVDVHPPVLVVSHDPACGIIGDDGNDVFFSKKKLPDGINVKQVIFKRIDEGEALNTIKVLANELLDMFEAMAGGAAGIGKWFAEKSLNLIGGLVDSKAGSYIAIIDKYPTEQDNSVVVHWENTCFDWSNYKSLPITYAISFVITGPEDKVRTLMEEPVTEFHSPITANDLYFLMHKYSGKYVCAGQTHNGGNVHQWGPVPPDHETRYQFQLVDAGDGYFYLVHQYSGKMVCAGDIKNGGNVHLWGPIPTGHQDRYKFRFEETENGFYLIKHKYSGKYICNGDKKNGGNIHLWGPIPPGHEDRYLFKVEKNAAVSM